MLNGLILASCFVLLPLLCAFDVLYFHFRIVCTQDASYRFSPSSLDMKLTLRIASIKYQDEINSHRPHAYSKKLFSVIELLLISKKTL